MNTRLKVFRSIENSTASLCVGSVCRRIAILGSVLIVVGHFRCGRSEARSLSLIVSRDRLSGFTGGLLARLGRVEILVKSPEPLRAQV